MSAIPAADWKHSGLLLRYLVVEQTNPGDDVTEIWIADPNDGPSVFLTADQLEEIADDFIARAAFMRQTAGRTAVAQ